MPRWTRWQNLLLLSYLLLLNGVVYVVLGVYLYRNHTLDFLFEPTPEPLIAIATRPMLPTAIPSVTPVPITATQLDPTPIETVTLSIVATNTPEPIPTETHTPQPTATNTSTTTNTPQPTATNTSTATNTPQPTATNTSTATNTPQPTATNTSTATNTPQPTATNTSTATNTPQPTATNTSTATNTPQPTATNTSTATNTPQPTATNTPLPTHTPQPTATNTPKLTATSTNTPKPTSTTINTPQPTVTNTPKPTATLTPTATHTPKPTSTYTSTPAPPPTATLRLETSHSQDVAVAAAVLPNDMASQPANRNHGLMEAVPLTNNSLALSWSPTQKKAPYRLYSDMGSGYGVYVYKSNPTEPAFLDEYLQPTNVYQYRLTQVEAGQETLLNHLKSSPIGPAPAQPRATITTTETIVAAPTALPPDAILLGLVSDNHYTDNFNTLHIVGEVRNDSTVDVGQVEIAVTMYNVAGTVIGTIHGQTLLSTIPPNEIAPFSLTLSEPTGLHSYSVRAIARSVVATSASQLSVVEVRRYEDNTGFFHVKGVVENVGSVVSKQIQVAAVIYGRNGQVVNVGFAVANPPVLSPGKRASYDILFTYFPQSTSQRVIAFEK